MPEVRDLPHGAQELREHDRGIREQNNLDKPITNPDDPGAKIERIIDSQLQATRLQAKPAAEVAAAMGTREQTTEDDRGE